MSASVNGLTADNANLRNAADPVLRKGEIQGDVIVGLQKDEEIFVFFGIANSKRFKKVLHDELLAQLTTTEEVLSREIQVQAHKNSGRRRRLPFAGFNLGFTHTGLVKLVGAGNASGMDASFTAGAAAQASSLGDPVDGGGKPKWVAAFAAAPIDGVLLITGPKKDLGAATSVAEDKAQKIIGALGNAIKVVYRESGAVRPQRGHEHFGFLDGVSNPGVRGITPRNNPVDENQGVPGQDLLFPGAFVFGYPGQDPDKAFDQPGPAPALAHPWMMDGSYMVFRRLNQMVPEFREFLDAQGEALGIDPQIIGARMIGRWQSGAPVMLSPLQDDPLLGAQSTKNNNFEYSQDKGGRRCPFGAHIRKTYPRDDLEDPNRVKLKNPEGFVQSHRIMRQGIPFGPEVEEDEDKTAKDRGLMFVCYQTSIKDQFEFIQAAWANAPGFPIDKAHPDGSAAVPGHDPIIGQAAGLRTMDEILPNYPTGNVRSTLSMKDPFVVPTAAAYFFMPSVSSIRDTLSR